MIMMVAGSWLEISISKQILSDFCFQEAAHESRAAVIGGGRAAVVTAGDDHDADGDADADDAADDEHDDNHDAQGNFWKCWSMVNGHTATDAAAWFMMILARTNANSETGVTDSIR